MKVQFDLSKERKFAGVVKEAALSAVTTPINAFKKRVRSIRRAVEKYDLTGRLDHKTKIVRPEPAVPAKPRRKVAQTT